MKLSEFFKQCQRMLEVKDSQDYNYAQMSKKIGVSERTYGEYVRGDIRPLSVKATLNLLGQLDNKDIIKIMEAWRKKDDKDRKQK